MNMKTIMQSIFPPRKKATILVIEKERQVEVEVRLFHFNAMEFQEIRASMDLIRWGNWSRRKTKYSADSKSWILTYTMSQQSTTIYLEQALTFIHVFLKGFNLVPSVIAGENPDKKIGDLFFYIFSPILTETTYGRAYVYRATR